MDDDYEYAVKQSYLYLRLSLVGTVIAIFLAVWLTPESLLPEGQGTLRSISHYYYSPARIVFVGALCAAALALLTLSGGGLQSYLLDIAAMLAPLIALIPTPVKLNQVAAFDPRCAGPDEECIPLDDYGYMQLGFRVWLCIVLSLIVIGFIRVIVVFRRPRGEFRPLLLPWMLMAALAIWVSLLWASISFQTWFNSSAHFIAAGLFFLLVSAVVALEAIRQFRSRPKAKVGKSEKESYAWGYLWTYWTIAGLIFVDLIIAAFIIWKQSKVADFAPIGVFVVEVIGLALFAAFFAVQTFHHRDDADGWRPLPKKAPVPDPQVEGTSNRVPVKPDRGTPTSVHHSPPE